jgi:hypothetical protein
MPKRAREDWKAPLFFWRGKLSFEGATLSWDGTWVSGMLEEGTPDTFASASTFRGTTPFHGPLTLTALAGATLDFKTSYLLDNGDGLQRFEDARHVVAFEAPPSPDPALEAPASSADGAAPPAASLGAPAAAAPADETVAVTPTPLLAGAQGDTEFGAFVSYGVAEAVDGSLRFTLARRYLGKGDSRASWDAASALQNCRAALAEATRSAPWAALPWFIERRKGKPPAS